MFFIFPFFSNFFPILSNFYDVLHVYKHFYSEAAEKAKEEAERKAEEERLEKERLEYEAMKVEFEVEDEGMDAITEEEEQNLLKQYIAYVKEQKVCFVDALASEFGLRNVEAVDRINSLMESGELTGVLDDRGKFIYISQ